MWSRACTKPQVSAVQDARREQFRTGIKFLTGSWQRARNCSRMRQTAEYCDTKVSLPVYVSVAALHKTELEKPSCALPGLKCSVWTLYWTGGSNRFYSGGVRFEYRPKKGIFWQMWFLSVTAGKCGDVYCNVYPTSNTSVTCIGTSDTNLWRVRASVTNNWCNCGLNKAGLLDGSFTVTFTTTTSILAYRLRDDANRLMHQFSVLPILLRSHADWLACVSWAASRWPAQFSDLCSLILSLSLMLRPTVSRPVYLRIKQPSGAYDQIFITVGQLRVCWCGALSLTRGRVCLLYMLLALASAVFSDQSPLVLATVFYFLRFETSLFVAFYNAQGHGGGFLWFWLLWLV
jgi:hypothetical protein